MPQSRWTELQIECGILYLHNLKKPTMHATRMRAKSGVSSCADQNMWFPVIPAVPCHAARLMSLAYALLHIMYPYRFRVQFII